MKIAENRTYIEDTDTLVVETLYDATDTIEANKEARALAPKHRVASGKLLTKVMDIDMEHILALKNKGYNLLSPDPAEWKRALLYIQQNEQVWMTVNGKPIAEKPQVWV
jgi:hypothetical protein